MLIRTPASTNQLVIRGAGQTPAALAPWSAQTYGPATYQHPDFNITDFPGSQSGA